MLKINRLRIELETDNGLYGIDKVFDNWLNFFHCEDKTKSLIIEALHYAMGFEEIIDGRGDKILASSYKKIFIEDGEIKSAVLGANIYLEITNGEEEVTFYRTVNMTNRDSNLITVFYSSLNSITSKETFFENMFVNVTNLETNAKEFSYYGRILQHNNTCTFC